MTDIIFLATIVAFFILCVGFVNVCGRIIGPDEIPALEPLSDDLSAQPQLEGAA